MDKETIKALWVLILSLLQIVAIIFVIISYGEHDTHQKIWNS